MLPFSLNWHDKSCIIEPMSTKVKIPFSFLIVEDSDMTQADNTLHIMFSLRPDVDSWLTEHCGDQRWQDTLSWDILGVYLEIPDDAVAVQFKLIFL